ncbi:MAG: Glucose-6-phosphate isomerase [Candidatus Argoarchaeum ethanivorans]|nr:MAG: Glucose-6-phosphate isomerase [Candidatus Argoarchaeum ethanivorans]
MWDTLSFAGTAWNADVRMLSDLKDVLYDQKWFEQTRDMPVYYMYRGLYKNEEDKKLMDANHLRYDITVIPPLMLGEEYVKTAGHCHPLIDGQTSSYTELYQVLEGEAQYLLQKAEDGVAEDVVLVHAKAGDILIIPPNYGHVTINNSNDVLKMSNWVSSSFTSIYEPVRCLRGAAYYFLEGGIIKNPNYKTISELREIERSNPELVGLINGDDMYQLIEHPMELDFLNNPEEHIEIFENAYVKPSN